MNVVVNFRLRVFDIMNEWLNLLKFSIKLLILNLNLVSFAIDMVLDQVRNLRGNTTMGI